MKIANILKVKKCKHGGKVKQYSDKLGLPEEEIIDFSANINPLGLPQGAKATYQKAFQALDRYPDDRYRRFRQQAARFLESTTDYKVSPTNIIPGNGSVEVLRMAIQISINPGDTVLIPTPTFGEYEHQARLFGAEVKFVDQTKLFNLRERNLEDAKVAFLCNPNNPTGKLSKREDIKKLAAKLRRSDIFLIVDEAFIELSQPEESVADLAISQDNLLVLRSLTKCFSIPGLRLGYGVGSEGLIKILNKVRIPWNLNIVASTLGTHLLQTGKEFLIKSRKYIKRERKWLKSELRRLGFKVYSSDTNFLLLDIRTFGISSTKLVKRVSSHGILLRDASSFQGLDDRHVRLAIRTRKENEQLIKALKSEIAN